MLFRGVLLLSGLLAVSIACAQSQPIKAVRLTKPPTIDGVVNDDEWKEVPFVEGLHDAQTGAEYADNGRFWIAYDDKYVYFGAKLKDRSPKDIRANEYRTNVGLTGDDYVELSLDLSGSLSAFNTFQINPKGATNIQIAGGRAAKREWLGAFVAKATITADGWEAEAKIPWQLMDVPGQGERNLRVNFSRFIPRFQRLFQYVYTGTQNALTPTWTAVVLPKKVVDHSIKLLPYIYSGYDGTDGVVFNSGLDMKTQLTDQAQLVGTINPDFRNIENQILSIDFSRFERIAGETRPFFQEGRNYSGSGLFASQRIRAFDVGINTYGRLRNDLSYGLIETADFGHENDLIFNLTHDPDPTTSLRLTMTDRSRPTNKNSAYLLRGAKTFGPWTFQARELASKDTAAGFGRFDDGSVFYFANGLQMQATYTRAEKEFAPRLAFFPEVDYQGPSLYLQYNRSYDRGPLNDWGAGVYALTYDHVDGTYYRKEVTPSLFTTLRSGFAIITAADFADFEGSVDRLYTLQLVYPRGNPYRNASTSLNIGTVADKPYRSLRLQSSYRVNKRLQLSLTHQTVNYQGTNTQMILSGNYDLGNDRSISGRAVRQDSDINAYVAFRRSGNEGIEYFLILGDPNAPKFHSSLILKMAIPLAIGKGHPALTTQIRNIISGRN